MRILQGKPQDRFDVVVVGSGAAALTAAATAANEGKSVLVVEKSALLGGTSAVSGGMLWVAANHLARGAGIADSPEDAARYVRAVSRGRGRDELFDAAIDSGDDMLRYVERELGVAFLLLDNFPDYRMDLDGALDGGRTVEPELFDAAAALGPVRAHVRTDGRAPFTMQEYEAWGAFTHFPWPELAAREAAGLVAKGQALVSMLLASCLGNDVTLSVDARAERLVVENGRVTGVVVDGRTFHANDGVVLACGGFEWDKELADGLLQTRLHVVCSPPSNTGDGLRMAQRIGARTGGTREAWWAPMSVIPGDLRDGEQVGTLLRFERQGPGSIMVNQHGRRFANESQDYNDLARALHSWDPAANAPLNTPAHVVFDHAFLERYGVLSHRAGRPTPAWLLEGATLADLAARIGVDPAALTETVGRFNHYAELGEDPDFGRGRSRYDTYWGDAGNVFPNPSLGPLTTGPFYALPVVNGAFGTSGGVSTDGVGRVVDVDGAVIGGLFAAGNTTESAYGAGYPGAGATLGPLMTMGYLIGRTLAGSPIGYPDLADAAATAVVR
ncbi:FAD-dependent oxidoreductase [Cryobacterium glucosi]|uniref:FAD-dependent oxidoreductase n=1 Tax=Cryobacterium glucosi TaxID=1259175 RepID=A0ABY2IS93_9MICO|nr:FAD-dependent oxidoreductase [Cryobacterium glucosi]TFC21737.1 FAD-dependent oxidoreductase [Cryobacterium glucosi]